MMPSCYQALHPVFHARKLTQYSKSTICGQKATLLPLTLIQGQEEWEVEKILNLQQKHRKNKYLVSQTSFGHIFTNSSTILTVSMATESPQKDLPINTSHTSKQSVLAEISGRSTGNHHGTIY